MALFRKRKPALGVAPLPAPTGSPLSTPADSGGTAVSRPGASWLAYPTLSHGNAGMVKMSGPTYYRAEINAAIRRYGALALAELRLRRRGNTRALCGSLWTAGRLPPFLAAWRANTARWWNPSTVRV